MNRFLFFLQYDIDVSFDIRWIYLGVALVLGFFIFRAYLKRKRIKATDKRFSAMDFEFGKLPHGKPSLSGTQLLCYDPPTKLVLVVLAPLGKKPFPKEADQRLKLLDNALKNLSKIALKDQPETRIWPNQLSSEGFSSSFFGRLGLPGDKGRGTPWVTLAGKVILGNQQFMIGLLLQCEEENNMGLIKIEQEHQWQQTLRVTNAS